MNAPPPGASSALAASLAGGVSAAVALAGAIGPRSWRVRRLLHRIDMLRARVRRLQKVAQLAGIGEYIWNVDTGALWWSPCSYRIYGLDPSAGIDVDRVVASIHPDDRADVQSSIEELLAGLRPPEVPFRVVRPDGSIRHVITTGELSVDEGQRRVLGVMKDVTELDRARTRLREAEMQYRTLFDHNPVPMWVLQPAKLVVVAANEAAERQFGYVHSGLVGRPVACLLPDEYDLEALDAARPASTWRQGAVATCTRRDGSTMRLALFVHDIVFDGQPATLVAAQDVTAREQNEQRFSMIARATSDAVYDLDLHSGRLWWSESFYAMFGHEPGSVDPSLAGWSSLVHPDDLDRVTASLEYALACGAAEWRESYRLQRSDGRYAQVCERGLIARGPKGEATRMVGGLVDETERRQQEGALRLLRRAVESTDNGVLIADARIRELPIVYANPAFERITGYTLAEICGRNCRMLQRGDRDQPGVEAIRRALREAHEVRTLLRNYRKDGTLFWNEVYIAPVRDERGALTHFVGILNDISERHRYEEQLAHRATHDELTGLPNRVLLEDRLQQAMHTSDRYNTGTAVVFIDIDDFKIVNDSLGHESGDSLLREVASRLHRAVRDTDTVSRFGGDEFVAVLSAPHREDRPSDIIARIMEDLSQPIQLGDVQHTVSASIGFCCYPAHGQDTQTLLRHADLAMYQAKMSGRNRAVEYRPEFDVGASQRLQLVRHLREALTRGEFRVLFQPQYGCAGKPLGMEALVRWEHPARGLLAPAEFIGACEDSGLIVQLGRHVLYEAARHHVDLVQAGLPGMRISVNVSAAQFTEELYNDVEHVVRTHSLPPGALELELTESVVMQYPERAIELMRRLAGLGVKFSIDDFGTGYSSLAYLKRFPIDRLKIDRSFVQDLDTNAQDAAICQSIIGLAKSLDIGIVAEGVETVEQQRWLHEHGCHALQGFLLGRPQTFDALLPELVAGRPAMAHAAP
jgi:diguanylate cyclase (GGDEF)-like protein/PAS domain S-box-containing protein